MKSTWKDITVADLMKIKEIGSLQLATDDEKNLMVAALLAKIDYDELINKPLDDARVYMDNTEFLLHEPKPEKVRRYYEVNGAKYRLLKDPAEMTVAQYLDFQNLYADGFDNRPAELLSIFLVPDGHEYNDGYDKDEVIADMYDLPVLEGLGIANFFTKRFARLTKAALTFFKLKMKWMRLTARKENKEMYKALEIQMNLILEELECTYGSLAYRQFQTLPNTTGKKYSE